MFGYVVINKPELKIKDFDKYQEYYCGLCQSLKQNHGRRGQLTLNYDLNFVGILLSSLYEPEEKQYWICCPMHPFHKKSVRTNQYMDYVSDMNIILTYFKLEDDVLDENSLKSKSFKQLLKKDFQRVKEKYPKKVDTIKYHLDQIHVLEQKNCLDLVRIWVKELRENYCGDSNIYHICVISDNVHHISVDLQMQTIFFTAISISEYTDKLCCSDNKLVHIDNPNEVLMFTAKAFTLAEPKKMNFLTKILLLSKEFLMQKYSPDFEQKFGRKLADNAREFFWKGSFEKLPLGRDNVIETSPILSFTSNASFEQIEQFEKKYYFSNVPIDEEFLREKQVGFQEKFFQWIFSEDGTFSWLKKYFTCNRIEQSRIFDLIPQMKVSQVIEQGKNDNQKILNEKLEKRYRELYENLISRDKGLCFNDFLQIEEIVEHFINDLIITVEQLINELNCEEWNEKASDEAVGQKDAIFKTWNSAIMTKIFSSSNMNEAQIQNELKNMISDSLTYFQDNRDFLGNIMDQLKVSSYDWVGFRNSIYDCFEFLVKMVYVGIGEDNSALNKDQYVFYRNEKYAPLIEKIKEDGKQTGWIEKSIQNEDRIEGVRFSAAYKLESLMGLNGEWGQV